MTVGPVEIRLWRDIKQAREGGVRVVVVSVLGITLSTIFPFLVSCVWLILSDSIKLNKKCTTIERDIIVILVVTGARGSV